MKALFKLSDDLELIPNNQDTLNWMAGKKAGDIVSFDVTDEPRNKKMNSCAHQYFNDLANALNAGGYTVQESIKIDMQFTQEIVKECMFKRIAKAMFPNKVKLDKKGNKQISTTNLSNKEMCMIYDNLNLSVIDNFNGLSVPWPSRFNH